MAVYMTGVTLFMMAACSGNEDSILNLANPKKTMSKL